MQARAQINGISLSYTAVGQGPAVLFVHAFPMAGAMWEPQVAALAGGYRVIAPDLRGFGASDVPDGPYTMEQQADDLAALLDTLGVTQTVFCGISMGGYIALAFARRHPGRLRALVLADTRATPDTPEGQAARELNARLVEQEGVAVLADRLVPTWLASGADSNVARRVRAIFVANQPVGVAAALRGMALRGDASDLLPAIAVPTLIIVGSDDTTTPPAEARTIHAAIPGSRLAEIPAAGHLSNLEQPAAFNTALHAFLQSL